MENQLLELIKLANPVQLVLTGLIIFFFYNRLKDDFKKEINKLDTKIDKLETRLEKLDEKIETIRRELNNKYDKLNDLVIDLYKTLFKKDVA